MKNSIIINIVMLGLGLGGGYFLFSPSGSNKTIATSNKTQKESIKRTSSKSIKKEPVAADLKSYQEKTELKNREVGSSEKVKVTTTTLLNKIAKKDHFPSGGGPNLEIIDLYKETLSLEPKNVKAYEQYASYLIKFSRYDEARVLLEKCLEYDPNNDTCLGNSVRFSLNNDDMETLEVKVDDCLKRRPQNFHCIKSKGNIFLRKKDGRAALKYFKKLEYGDGRLHFGSALVYLGLAMSYEQLGNREETIKYFDMSCSEGQKYACRKVKEIAAND